MLRSRSLVMLLAIGLLAAIPAAADSLLVSTGVGDGRMAMASRIESSGKIEIEAGRVAFMVSWRSCPSHSRNKILLVYF